MTARLSPKAGMADAHCYVRTPPLRYLLFATHVPASGKGGGVVRYTVELANALSRRTDVELHVLVSKRPSYFDSVLPAHRIHSVGLWPVLMRSFLEWLSPVIMLRQRFDVVHGTKQLVPRRAGEAVKVLTVHDMIPLDRPYDFGLAKRWLLRWPYLSSIQDSDVIIPVSRAARARMLDYVPGAVNATRVVPLAPSTKLLAAVPRPVPELVGRRFALIVGDLSARKNAAMVTETWHNVRQVAGDAVLAMVGPPSWSKAEFGKDWDNLYSSGAVASLGHVTDGALRWCYEHATVVLCPSKLEGFGLPVVEASAFGAPVITTDDPALCEAGQYGAREASERISWRDVRGWTAALTRAFSEQGSARPKMPATRRRNWDDVAAEVVQAVRAPRSQPAEPGAAVGDRVGIDPFNTTMRVLHVVHECNSGGGAEARRLVREHRRAGWEADVVGDEEHPRAAVGYDVVVLYGEAARWRLSLRGVPTTVVTPGERFPRGPIGWMEQAVLARWTNAVVVTSDDAARRWRRLLVPLARVAPAPSGGLDAVEFAAVIARAGAWGQVVSQR